MSIRTSPWPAGVPCWVDLATPDPQASSALYAELFGWSVQDTGPDFGHYRLCGLGGGTAAGIGPAAADGPPGWTLYFATDDVDATAEAIAREGGRLLSGPFDVGDTGRMLVATDPVGAVFGAWQHGTSIGASVVNETGALVWEDGRSGAPARSREFYASVLGWAYEPLPGVVDYTTFSLGDGVPLGGLGGFGDLPDQGRPSHWLPYFGTASADSAVEVVARHGGTSLEPARDTPFGRLAVLRDQVGAVFAVIEVDPERMPDREG